MASLPGLDFDITGSTVTNVEGNGLNVYYLTSANPGLTGVYSLTDGGQLRPWDGTNPVPIPGALWLLAPGLAALVGFRKRFALK
jgi:hypothetical protein